ncbi:DEAD/DEAH box helicase family protein [Cytobacillus dafuensis]|uniref:Uncharacterized protein n=1 Tax=Cytobacillus dafuensis TaxID=1742359 RepID=A0A5B8Z9F7_CYTDA|nr:hypothetical protein [Cytobacillus dafuensis]QED48086.1 hypothetical protein FSZ17_13015 [Cytobacillus dafuensis]
MDDKNDDGLRVHGEQKVREENNCRMKELLRENGIEFESIKGTYQERLEREMELIGSTFAIKF